MPSGPRGSRPTRQRHRPPAGPRDSRTRLAEGPGTPEQGYRGCAGPRWGTGGYGRAEGTVGVVVVVRKSAPRARTRQRARHRLRVPGWVRRPGWLQGPAWLRQSWLRQSWLRESRLLARARTRRGTWTRRSFLVVVLIGAAIVPGRAGSAPRTCAAARHAVGGHAVTGHCPRSAGTIRWTHRLPGSWIAENGALGTVLSTGEAYAGVSSGVVAVGFAETVTAYQLSNGRPLWTTSLASTSATSTSLPVGSAVESVRAWPGVITAGVAVPPSVAGGAVSRVEVVLSAATGQVIRSYPAAPYGGAVSAGTARTVIVGTTTVTAYDNATGRVAWQVQTGPVAQAWRVSGGDLFVTVAAGGYLGASPVTALRRIDLQTGQQSLVRDRDQPFAGSLSYAMTAWCCSPARPA